MIRNITALRGPGLTTVLSGVGGQAFLMVSGVLVARMLPVSERGQLALMGLLPFILCHLGGLGIPLAATYELARRPGCAGALARLLARVVPLQLLALSFAHIGILTILFRDAGASVFTAALITIAAVPALFCQQLGVALLQGLQRFVAFNVQRILPLAAYALILSIIAIAGVGTLVLCAAAWAGAWLLAGVITISTAARGLRTAGGDSGIERRSFFRFGRRGVLGTVFPLEAFQIDQLIVGLVLSASGLGLYVVAVAFTNLPRFVAQSVGMVAYPRIAALKDRRAATSSMWRYFGIAAGLSSVIVAALEVTVGSLLPFFFGDAYAPAVPVARILLLAALFQALRRVLADAARGLGHPELGTIAEVASWFVLAPTVILLAPHGLQGIALAMVVTYGASLAVLVVGVVTRGGRPRQLPEDPSVTVPADGPGSPAPGSRS